MKILLAEDDSNIITIAKLALEKVGGHSVDVVTDGDAALTALLQPHSYDVIMLDEMMPKINGREVLQRYKARTQTWTPVIFMSANHRNLETTPLQIPEIGYIPKPFDPMQLSQQVQRLFDEHKQKKQAA